MMDHSVSLVVAVACARGAGQLVDGWVGRLRDRGRVELARAVARLPPGSGIHERESDGAAVWMVRSVENEGHGGSGAERPGR
jgi:hypothetical protein